MTPGDRVTVSHPHPRTGQRGLLSGEVLGLLRSGRVAVLLTVEGKRYRVVTDAANVRAAA